MHFTQQTTYKHESSKKSPSPGEVRLEVDDPDDHVDLSASRTVARI